MAAVAVVLCVAVAGLVFLGSSPVRTPGGSRSRGTPPRSWWSTSARTPSPPPSRTPCHTEDNKAGGITGTPKYTVSCEKCYIVSAKFMFFRQIQIF